MTDSADRPGDEPSLSDEEWVEYGGELIRAVESTPGGAPTGLTAREFRRLNAALEHRAGWARAFETRSSSRSALPPFSLIWKETSGPSSHRYSHMPRIITTAITIWAES
jgi:hypothetical protein